MTDWRILLRLGRVSNLPTVWSNAVAGMVLGGPVNAPTLATVIVAVSLFYTGGMFLNDAFDREVDAVERPERPIPSGRISAGTVLATGYGLLIAGLILLVPLGWTTVMAGLALCGFILFYDLYHKQNPFSPILMGLCRALVYIVAASAMSGHIPIIGAALMIAYVAGLTYTAKQENLLEFENAWPLAIFAIPLIWVCVAAVTSALPFLLLFLVWTAHALRMVLLPKARDIRQAVGAMIAGISLLDAVLIAEAEQPGWAAAATAAFLLTLLLHRRISGT